MKIESWNFLHLFDLGFRKTLQNFSSFRQTFRRHFSTGNKSCQNELKFWCWKFHISILTNKKVVFQKKILSLPCTMGSHYLALKTSLKSHQMTTLFIQNDNVFTQMLIFSLKPLFWAKKKLSFDDFLLTTWEWENKSKRKKEPEIQRHG